MIHFTNREERTDVYQDISGKCKADITVAYRWQTGSMAWLIHRVSGIVLTLYLFAHLYVLSNLRDPERFASIMNMMKKNTLVKFGEVGLLVLVAAHALNGVRVTALELGVTGRHQKSLFWAAAAGCLAVMTYGAVVMFGGVH